MGSILEKIEQALKDMLIGWIESNLTNMFTDVNEKVGTIAAEVGQTPSGWNGGVYQMIRGLSENVIVPIAGIIITFVLCYELIRRYLITSVQVSIFNLFFNLFINLLISWNR